MKLAVPLLILFAAIPGMLYAQKIEIEGTRVFTEEKLKSALRISSSGGRKINLKKIKLLIENYYKDKGYELARVYITDNNQDTVKLYVDEGRLGKIVFLNLNELETIRIKNSFTLYYKIFHRATVEKNLREIKKNFNYHSLTYRLVPAPEFSESLFQLDREYQIPMIGKSQIPFFEEAGSRFDLEIKVIKSAPQKKSSGSDSENQNESRPAPRLGYKLRGSFTYGLIPEVRLYQGGFLRKDDNLEIGTSAGFFYALDGDFTAPPRITFFQVDSIYKFAPIRSDIFTPVLKGLLYRTSAGRADLGLLSYDYWLVNGVAAPGFTFFKKLHIYGGAGFETVTFLNSRTDPESVYQVDIEEKTDYYKLLESEIKFEYLPIRIGSPLKKNIVADASYYFNGGSFSKIIIDSEWDFEFKGKSIYSLNTSYKRIRGDVPFHHEKPVTNNAFRGLGGYYTRHSISAGSEYRLSLYREYIYAGLFIDGTVFEGSGYDITGVFSGLAAGPTMRIIILDQFEFYIHYGRDLLIPRMKNAQLLLFSLSKKW